MTKRWSEAVFSSEVVATADGPQAMEAIALHRPDVVLLTSECRHGRPEHLRRLLSAPQRPIVAVLTTFDSDQYIAAAVRLGAAGFLLRDTDPEQLCHFVGTL